MPPLHAVSVILDLAGLADSAATATERAIVETIRLPRIVLALLVGGALGVSGAIMQGLFRNPMADPGIIGVSTGGAVGRGPRNRNRRQCGVPARPASYGIRRGGRRPWRWCTRWLQRAGDFLWPRCCLPVLR